MLIRRRGRKERESMSDRGEYNNREAKGCEGRRKGTREREERAGKVCEAVKGREGRGGRVAKRNGTTMRWAREGESVAVG